MKNIKLNSAFHDDDCVVGEDSNLPLSAKIPYDTKQLNNWVASNKGKVHKHHLRYFRVENDKEQWEKSDLSFDDKEFLYLTQKDMKKVHLDFENDKESKSMAQNRIRRVLQTTFKSLSETRKKSSRDLLRELFL